ncbi:Tripartite tricarboxylate transporter family receptor [Belnapia rosea]|uniref:Tripartite tricarboxylate transporter family receptor n=2 Tax=Belnapia rosea TaxID=938405 RepID=A0A1G6RIM7_9PROT|nr:Tripartite tricarboxylate transporter family receptor [Belnapia rosea]
MGRREALEALDLLGVVAETPLIIAASPNQPIRSARDLVETLKQGNARLNISGGGTGLQSPAYRCYTLLQRMINARADYVPYRTAAAALQDTLAGSVHIFVGSLAIADEAIRTGRLMPLARLSSAVAPGFEALPTLDQFIPGFRFSVWTGIMSPRGAPQAIRDMLSSDIIAAAQAPAFREQIGSIGLVPLALGRSEAMQLVRLEIDLWLDRWCCRGGG